MFKFCWGRDKDNLASYQKRYGIQICIKGVRTYWTWFLGTTYDRMGIY